MTTSEALIIASAAVAGYFFFVKPAQNARDAALSNLALQDANSTHPIYGNDSRNINPYLPRFPENSGRGANEYQSVTFAHSGPYGGNEGSTPTRIRRAPAPAAPGETVNEDNGATTVSATTRTATPTPRAPTSQLPTTRALGGYSGARQSYVDPYSGRQVTVVGTASPGSKSYSDPSPLYANNGGMGYTNPSDLA